MKNKIILVIIFSLIIITTAISGSYAYFKVSSEDNNANVNITVTAPTCITLQLEDLVSLNISNEYAVPVSDNKALSSTIYRSSFSVVNNCDSSQTTDIIIVPSASSNMPMQALKYVLVKQSDSLPSTGSYFPSPVSLVSNIVKEMAQKGAGTVNQGFVIGNETISASTTINYYLYIWIDKNEGNLGNNITLDKNFNGYLTLSTNASSGTAATLASISDISSSNSSITATITKGTFDLAYYGISDEDGNAPKKWISLTSAGGTITTPKLCKNQTAYVYAKDIYGNVVKSSSTVSVTDDSLLLGDVIACKNDDIISIASKGKPDFNTISTTNEGLYLSSDNDGVVYYYRGAVDNNWVKFGQENGTDIWWRIIRTNGDGSVRLLYAGTTAPNSSQAVFMTTPVPRITVGGSSTFNYNSARNSAVFTGFQYITGEAHGYGKCTTSGAASCTADSSTVNNSLVKQKIETWWDATNLNDLYTAGKIVDSIMCNDRDAYTNGACTTAAAVTATAQYFAAYCRLQSKKQPSLVCNNIADRFTVNASRGEGLTEGNGALLYPVGLITADEYAMAGGKHNTINTSLYLHMNAYYWSMSPYYYTSSQALMWAGFNNRLQAGTTNQSYGIRPVISLSSNLTLSGSGTWDDPYTVS